jgi:hypothetical protein
MDKDLFSIRMPPDSVINERIKLCYSFKMHKSNLNSSFCKMLDSYK